MRLRTLTTAAFTIIGCVESADNEKRTLRRAQDYCQPIPIRHDFENGGYWAQVRLGTPGSTLDMQLYSDWAKSIVLSSNSTLCETGGCADHGSFNQNLSTTFSLHSDVVQVNATYSNGTIVVVDDGYQFSDTLQMGPLTVSNLSMAVIYEALVDPNVTTWTNILGLSYGWGEQNPTPGNLIVQMVKRGLIPTEAYSLWLNTPAADSLAEGELVLGAIDTAKYEGDLVSVDTFNASSQGGGPWVLFTSLEATSPTGSDILFESASDPIPVSFDISSPASWLPQTLAEQMWAVVGAEYNASQQWALVPCKLRESVGTFQVRFGGPEGPLVTIPMRQLVCPSAPGSNWYAESWNAQGEELCAFAIRNTSIPSSYFFAMNILSDAYIVFDLYNEKVAMAPAKYNTTDSNIVPFRALHAGIPSATLATNQPTVTPTSIANTTTAQPLTSTSYAAAAGFTSLTAATSPTGSACPSSTGSGGLSTGAKAGIGVGVSIAGILIILGIGSLLWRQARRNRPPPYTPETATVSTFQSPETRTETPATWVSSEAAHDWPKYQVAEMPDGQGHRAELSPSTVDFTHELDASGESRTRPSD
ncbi:aspartic peptidase domain-containing protein [Xylariomycetidae sp. FL2044]|nr:aspartic peptidase domain-containing protein [Xylariomycetidae sp. FL2044]